MPIKKKKKRKSSSKLRSRGVPRNFGSTNKYKKTFIVCFPLGKTHKKSVFFIGRNTKVLPYTNGLVVHATFKPVIFSLCSFPVNFLHLYKKKVVGGGLPLPTPLVVRPIKKTNFFMFVFPYCGC